MNIFDLERLKINNFIKLNIISLLEENKQLKKENKEYAELMEPMSKNFDTITGKLTEELTDYQGISNFMQNIQDKFCASDKIVDANYNIEWGMRSYANSGGGDYFDYIQSDGKKWAVILDIAGHGGFASMLMIVIKTIFLTSARTDVTINDMLVNLNTIFGLVKKCFPDDQNRHATLFILKFDDDGNIEYNGNHDPMFIIGDKKTRILNPLPGFLWLGVMDQNRYEKQLKPNKKFKLNPGEKLILYTDGITESNKDGKLIGEKFKLLLEKNKSLSAHHLKKTINDYLDAINIEDDCTFCCIEKK